MIDATTFDELNSLVTNKRAKPFETYFGDMELSEEQKEKRITLAEKMKNEFLFVMALLFNMYRYSSIEWENIRRKFEQGYLNAIKGKIDIDDYMKSHIASLSYDFIDSTKRNVDEPYFMSSDRATVYSEEESNTSYNHQEFKKAINEGKTKKKWIDIRDKKERKTHRKVGGKVIAINEPFIVGNSLMMYPKDVDTYGAEPEEYVNCRCSIKYF